MSLDDVFELQEDRRRLRKLITQGLAELIDHWRQELAEVEEALIEAESKDPETGVPY